MTDVTRAWPRIAGSGTRAVTVTPTDTELVEACLAGRRDAFDAMVEWHHRAVYRFCVRFVGRHEDARDLVQDCSSARIAGCSASRGTPRSAPGCNASASTSFEQGERARSADASPAERQGRPYRQLNGTEAMTRASGTRATSR
ncbi:MAG: hypothetical protein HOQ29_09790 [Acidobacteria bacterium]|nr:hypothetical protein [Acidobacteriota bacterium]